MTLWGRVCLCVSLARMNAYTRHYDASQTAGDINYHFAASIDKLATIL